MSQDKPSTEPNDTAEAVLRPVRELLSRWNSRPHDCRESARIEEQMIAELLSTVREAARVIPTPDAKPERAEVERLREWVERAEDYWDDGLSVPPWKGADDE